MLYVTTAGECGSQTPGDTTRIEASPVFSCFLVSHISPCGCAGSVHWRLRASDESAHAALPVRVCVFWCGFVFGSSPLHQSLHPCLSGSPWTATPSPWTVRTTRFAAAVWSGSRHRRLLLLAAARPSPSLPASPAEPCWHWWLSVCVSGASASRSASRMRPRTPSSLRIPSTELDPSFCSLPLHFCCSLCTLLSLLLPCVLCSARCLDGLLQ
jgi:hypothetical protein